MNEIQRGNLIIVDVEEFFGHSTKYNRPRRGVQALAQYNTDA